jgi:hypothetical protein
LFLPTNQVNVFAYYFMIKGTMTMTAAPDLLINPGEELGTLNQ